MTEKMTEKFIKNTLLSVVVALSLVGCDVVKLYKHTPEGFSKEEQELAYKEKQVINFFDNEINSKFADSRIKIDKKFVGTYRSSQMTREMILYLSENGELGGFKYEDVLVISILLPPDTKQKHEAGNIVRPLVEGACQRSGKVYREFSNGNHIIFVIGEHNLENHIENGQGEKLTI